MSTHAPPISEVSLVLISSRCIFLRGQCDNWVLCKLFPPPMRPTHTLRPAQGTYSVTFASSPIYTEAWSRFPYCARVGDQALRRASVPSDADPSYVDRFRVSSYPYLLPGEGPSVDSAPADSRVEYVSFFNLFLFFYVFVSFKCCLLSC